jgi:hypothetical protein
MLRRMPWRQFQRWQAFDEVEPIGGVRLDYNTASIVSTLVNLRRNTEKHPEPFHLVDFLLKWGGEKKDAPVETPKPTQKTWQQLKFMGQWLSALYNQAEETPAKRRRNKE